MPIPDYQTMMLPTLRLLGDNKEHRTSDLIGILSTEFKLTQAELEEMLPSGTQPRFANRLYWVIADFRGGLLVNNVERGVYKITERGLDLLKENPKEVRIKDLLRYEEYKNFKQPKKKSKNETQQITAVETEQTPVELFEAGYIAIRQRLSTELLQTIKTCSPSFFERLVVELLVAMGYGGSFTDAAEVIGKSGDGGIDGIIKEDKLGLDSIYVQAKRWQDNVGRPTAQAFAGALEGRRARKGVLITTSYFTEEAKKYVENIEKKIVLIDGEHLAELMIDYDIGVSIEDTYVVKKVDNDYFTEE